MISDEYRNELQAALANTHSTEEDITYIRGRYISSLSRDIRQTTDVHLRNALINEVRTQQRLHQEQLNRRLTNVKRHSENSAIQIPRELGIKINKVANNIRQIVNSNSTLGAIGNSFRLVGNLASTTVTIAKAPVIAALRISGALAPVAGWLVVQPIQIPAYLFSQIINPDGEYNGQIISNLGRELGTMLGTGLNATADIIRRM